MYGCSSANHAETTEIWYTDREWAVLADFLSHGNVGDAADRS